jgi:hypothetical protein
MATKRGKNKPIILVSRGGSKAKSPRTLVLLNRPRKRASPQNGHLLLPCNTLKYLESAPNYARRSNCHVLQPYNWV